MFSYGSGMASSMFLINTHDVSSIRNNLIDIESRLAKRIKITPSEFE